MVYLLVQAIALGVVLSIHPEHLSRYGKRFWWVVIIVTTFAVLASLRRGGVMSSGILLLYLFAFSSFRNKLRLTTLLFLALPLIALLAMQFGMIDALLLRFAGEGKVAISDFGRETDVLQAREHISKHFWFGTGAATKLALLRTQAYGVAESLSIHHAVYHIWIRFGLFGAVFYSLLFLHPFLHSLLTFQRFAKTQADSTFLPLVISMSGLIASLFIWGLHIPAIFINFRQAGVWIVAAALIYATAWARKPEATLPQFSVKRPMARAF